jgi:hypothetical protein
MAECETIEIDKAKWQPFFDSVSSSLRGQAADISMSTPTEYVHQSKVWQLHGLTYDPYDDALIVSCRTQEHVISGPTRIRVERRNQQIEAVEVVKNQGEREVIRFIAPLLLP